MKITAYEGLNGQVYKNKLACTIADLEFTLQKKISEGSSSMDVNDATDLKYLAECGKMAAEILRLRERAAEPVKQPETSGSGKTV